MSRNKERGGCGLSIIFFLFFIIIRGCIGEEYDSSSNLNFYDDRDKIVTDTSHFLDWADSEHPVKKYTGTIDVQALDYYSSKKYKASCSPFEMTDDELKKNSNALECLKKSIVWNKNISNYSAEQIISDLERETLYVIGHKTGWKYKKCYLHDKSKLDFVYSMFDEIQKREKLTRYNFANMIISYVQNIEYSLPWPGNCKDDYNNTEMVKDLVDQGYDCYSYVPFGFYAPVEFLGKWTGDCDTRSMLVYTILQHYGYDVVILGSQYYGHSILGVNLTPLKTSNPLYKLHDYKKYYVWELTAPSVLGILHPSWNDMKHWNVDLDNDLDYSIITYLN